MIIKFISSETIVLDYLFLCFPLTTHDSLSVSFCGENALKAKHSYRMKPDYKWLEYDPKVAKRTQIHVCVHNTNKLKAAAKKTRKKILIWFISIFVCCYVCGDELFV